MLQILLMAAVNSSNCVNCDYSHHASGINLIAKGINFAAVKLPRITGLEQVRFMDFNEISENWKTLRDIY